MDFFQDEGKAHDILADYQDNPHMYLWPLSEAFKAAQLIFRVRE